MTNPQPTSIKRQITRSLLTGLIGLWLMILAFFVLVFFQVGTEQEDRGLQNLNHIVARLLDKQNPQLLNHDDKQLTEDLLRYFDANADDNDDEIQVGFSIWDKHGKRLFADEFGKAFAFQSNQGFVDTQTWWKPQAMRIYYQHYPQQDNGYTIAVGQNWTARTIPVLFIWLVLGGISLSVIGLVMWIAHRAVKRGLLPLNQLSDELKTRQTDDVTPLYSSVFQELTPLVSTLNRLFVQVGEQIEQEQRFTADAAHELRSPLAAIKTQSNVLAKTKDRQTQQYLAQKVEATTNRATHLIEQLLTLSRLDQTTFAENGKPIDWLTVSETALQSVHHAAREKRIALKRHITTDTPETILPLNGDTTLLTLLLRNLLDNAVRYSFDGNDDLGNDPSNADDNQQNNVVELTLANDHISVRDHGKGIDPEHLNSVRERFFRPAGQTEIGSGLGLSIVERIAELYGLGFSLDNHEDGGVVAIICKIAQDR